MKIALSNQVTLTDAPRSLVKAVKTRSTFPNPAFTEAERRGRWTGDLERTLAYY
jgi:hypothetical protein